MTTNFKQNPKEEAEETLFLRSIPKEIKQRFKAKCAEADVTMQDALIAFMKRVSVKELSGDSQA